MCKVISISFLLLVSISTLVLCQSLSKKDLRDLEKQILDQILDKTKYESTVAPVNINGSGVEGPVILRTNMFIRSVEYICTKKHEWKVQITFRHQWKDPRLQFDTKSGQISFITLLDISRLWTPDTFISNSWSTQQNVDLKPNVLARIYPDGDVLFSMRLTTTLTCPMSLKHYPFDTQICGIQFASYGFTTADSVLIWKEGDPIQVTKSLNLPDFTLKRYSTDYCTSRTNTGEYSCLKAQFQFKRESCKYVMQWLIPTALLTFISFASFWLKPKKCARVKLLAIILGLLYLHIMYINKSSPTLSYSTAKDCWLHTCLIFVLAAFVEYGIVVIVNKRNKQSKRQQNGKSDPEGDPIVMKPLVEKSKDNNTEGCNQYTVNQCTHQTLMKKWGRADTSSRIDMICAVLFPLLFVVYIMIFSFYQAFKQTDSIEFAKDYINKN